MHSLKSICIKMENLLCKMRTIMYCVMHDSNCSYSDKKYVTYSTCLRVVNVVINQQTKLECFGVKLCPQSSKYV